jgi:AhpD family alkylhydroperoxidase
LVFRPAARSAAAPNRRQAVRNRNSKRSRSDDAEKVEFESEQSFPASDAPSWPVTRLGAHGDGNMTETMYPLSPSEIGRRRREWAPDIHKVFDAFSQAVFADGALSAKTKQLIAVAVAHATQCPCCFRGHTKAAQRHGATPEELMEAIWAAEMRAGGAFAHSTIALTEMEEAQRSDRPQPR